MKHVDVLIVGAGPAGSALAAAMAAAGASVTLIDAAEHPRPKACAEYASPRIVEELARIGLAPDAWRDTAVPLRGMDLRVGERSARISYAGRRGPRSAWGLSRRSFDERLARHAADSGADLRERTRLVRLVHRAGRVHGAVVRDLRNGSDEVILADHAVGADGARSTVARMLGVDRPVAFPRRLGLVAHYTGVDALTDHGEMHVGGGWYVGLAPTPGGELNVGMALPFETSRGGSRQRFEDAIAGLPAVAERLRGAQRTSPIRGASPIGHRVARVAGPGWMLIGDAAGFVDPFTGEGIHRALRSSRAAAAALLGARDVPNAYRRERRAAFTAKAALSWAVQGALAAPGLMELAAARLESRPAVALKLGSALGDCRPATDALTPRAIWDMLSP